MILLIDTSTAELLVAIATDPGVVLKESRQSAAAGERGIHDARLATEVAQIIQEVGSTSKDIRRIGIVIGPGSFTGLRIGLAFVKGFCFGRSVEVVPITQHEALANEVVSEFDYIVTAGYRPGLYYVAKAGAPWKIEPVQDLDQIAGKRVLAHTALATAVAASRSYSFAEITSHALARVTHDSSTPLGEESLGALEPLYVTDFNVATR
jgi:tRNA threonylcarbamoyl adenosine modification protein YeaZ